MSTIGGTGHGPALTDASKQSVTGAPLASPASRCAITAEELKLLIPALSQFPPAVTQTFLDMAEVFGIDTADLPTVMALFGRYARSFENPAEFQNELNSRDTHGFLPLHRAVMQGKEDVVQYFCGHCGADAGELVTGVGFREVSKRSIGVRNKQVMLDNNPHAGRNALTLAVTRKADRNMIRCLAATKVNGQMLANLRDGHGDTAVCLAIEHDHQDAIGPLVHISDEAGRMANGEGVKPIALAIKNGHVATVQAVLGGYLPALSDYAPATTRELALADLTKVARLLAACWTGHPNQKAVLACLLREHSANFRDDDGFFVRVFVFPLEHCVDVLFDAALKRVGSEPDSYDLLECCTAADLGKRDYSLIQELLKHKAHHFLHDYGGEVFVWALYHKNDILLDLCTKAGIRPASSDTDSGSDSDA
jgi:Ankyrin repeat